MTFWKVRLSGFDDVVALAETAAKARWAVFAAAKDAGYYNGRGGFAKFLAHVGGVSQVSTDEARRCLGGHKPTGAQRNWEWSA